MIPYLFSAILLSKSLIKLILDKIVNLIPYRFFISTDIPSVTEELARNKVYDFFEWGLFFVLSFVIFFSLYFLHQYTLKNNRSILFKYSSYLYLLVSVITFFNVQFATHSIKSIVIVLIAFNLIYWFSLNTKKSNKEISINYKTLFNGFLAGLIFSLVIGKSSTLVLYVLVFFPFVYILLSTKYPHLVNGDAHLVLLAGLIFHDHKLILAIIVLITALLMLSKKIVFKSKTLSSYLYLVSSVFVVLYNPLFYVGILDTVEEGFWLGWLQRLINGDFIYRDFYAYHPPFLVWFLYLFSKATSFSVFTARFYFHILYLLGMIIISLISSKLIKNKLLLVSALLIIFSITGGQIKNNIEIRLGLGMFSLLLLYMNFLKDKPHKTVVFAGILGAISVFTSIEVGMAAIASGSLYILIQARNKLKCYILYFIGFSFIALPTAGYLFANKAIIQFFLQITSYSKAFSFGYFNIPVERPFELAFFYWHIFFEYLSSNMFYWFFVQLSFCTILIWFCYKKFIKHKEDKRDNFAFILAIFGSLLSRSALGRSDYYHLLFILIVAYIVFFYIIDSLLKEKLIVKCFLVSFFILIVAGNPVKYFISNVFHKFQTYGEPIGNYSFYNTKRSGILFEEDKEFVTRKNELIGYLSENTDKNEKIFTFPWMPDLYFLSDRGNATSYDTPYAFLEKYNQEKIVKQLNDQRPKFIVYNPNFNFGNLNTGSLKEVDNYINLNYTEAQRYGNDVLMLRNKN